MGEIWRDWLHVVEEQKEKGDRPVGQSPFFIELTSGLALGQFDTGKEKLQFFGSRFRSVRTMN